MLLVVYGHTTCGALAALLYMYAPCRYGAAEFRHDQAVCMAQALCLRVIF